MFPRQNKSSTWCFPRELFDCYAAHFRFLFFCVHSLELFNRAVCYVKSTVSVLMWLKYCTRQYSESFWPLSTLLAQACFSINTRQRKHNKDLVRAIFWDCHFAVSWVHYKRNSQHIRELRNLASRLQLQDEGPSINFLDAFGSVFL